MFSLDSVFVSKPFSPYANNMLLVISLSDLGFYILSHAKHSFYSRGGTSGHHKYYPWEALDTSHGALNMTLGIGGIGC